MDEKILNVLRREGEEAYEGGLGNADSASKGLMKGMKEEALDHIVYLSFCALCPYWLGEVPLVVSVWGGGWRCRWGSEQWGRGYRQN